MMIVDVGVIYFIFKYRGWYNNKLREVKYGSIEQDIQRTRAGL